MIGITGVGVLKVVLGGLGVLVRLCVPAILVFGMILLVLTCGELLTLVILVVVILVILRKVFVIIGRLFLVLLVRSLKRTLAVTLYLMPRLTKPWIDWAT